MSVNLISYLVITNNLGHISMKTVCLCIQFLSRSSQKFTTAQILIMKINVVLLELIAVSFTVIGSLSKQGIEVQMP